MGDQPKEYGLANDMEIYCWHPIPDATHFLSDGDPLPILNGTAMHLPGTSPGHFGFYFKQHNFLVAGESIQKTFLGDCKFPGSDADTLIKSVKKVLTLPDNTTILCSNGHDALTTVAIERKFNPLKPVERDLVKEEDERNRLEARRIEEVFRDKAEKDEFHRLLGQEFIPELQKIDKVEGYVPRPSKKEQKRKARAKRWKDACYFPDYVTRERDPIFGKREETLNLDEDTDDVGAYRRSLMTVDPDKLIAERRRKIEKPIKANNDKFNAEDHQNFLMAEEMLEMEKRKKQDLATSDYEDHKRRTGDKHEFGQYDDIDTDLRMKEQGDYLDHGLDANTADFNEDDDNKNADLDDGPVKYRDGDAMHDALFGSDYSF
eukprot:CAMPEP_0197538046 /NCGR_PEP_ID=MMETSP1318-20131121/58690_1 /TAXON_ID=552666 /ORGANISM="Partenskyella glossopodia, Strain RCC365" /LENGTH=374 /DNA_ID=CAMNT_0043096363 /DNA_START=57 /DNA_END=1181 /DNA_ORIENTATION=+